MDKKIQYIAKICTTMIEEDSWADLREYLDSLNISEVENLIDEIPDFEAQIIDSMSLNRAISVFSILDYPTQHRVLEKLPKTKVKQIFIGLPPDDRTAFLSDVEDNEILHQLVALLSPEDRKEAFILLSYPEDSIGRLMTLIFGTI